MRKYTKLEVRGEWSTNDETKTKIVNISFGSISLNISDSNNYPISQWAYTSVRLIESNSNWTIFSPDLEDSERLKVYDVDAVEYLLSLNQLNLRKKPRKFLRWFLILSFIVILTGLFNNYYRLALEKLALSLTSKEQEALIGQIIYGNIKDMRLCSSEKIDKTISDLIEINPKLQDAITQINFLVLFY